MQVVGSGLRIGILILLFNGVMYALFSPSFNLATVGHCSGSRQTDAVLRLGCLALKSAAHLAQEGVRWGQNDQWHTLPDGVPHLVVYTAFFYFSTAFFVISTCVQLYASSAACAMAVSPSADRMSQGSHLSEHVMIRVYSAVPVS